MSRSKKRPRQWARMKPSTFIRAQLQDCAEDLEAAREADSWQAARDFRRMLRELYVELQQVEAKERADRTEGGVPADATDEEVVGLIEAAAEDLPDDLVDRLLEALLDRRPEMREALDAAGVL